MEQVVPRSDPDRPATAPRSGCGRAPAARRPLPVTDGRSAEAIRLKRIKADLTRHVGGNPSETQKILIERCAILTLRLHLMDRKSMENAGTMAAHAQREYLAWSNALERT